MPATGPLFQRLVLLAANFHLFQFGEMAQFQFENRFRPLMPKRDISGVSAHPRYDNLNHFVDVGENATSKPVLRGA